jgi:hypothetical protein
MVQGIPSFNPAAANRAASAPQNSSATTQAFQRYPALKSIFQALNISPAQVSRISSRAGADRVMVSDGLTQIQTVQVTAEQANILASLGLAGASVAISIQSTEELDKIRKRLDKLKQPSITNPHLQTVFGTLGLPFDDESVVLTDENGGVFVIQAGLKELEE